MRLPRILEIVPDQAIRGMESECFLRLDPTANRDSPILRPVSTIVPKEQVNRTSNGRREDRLTQKYESK